MHCQEADEHRHKHEEIAVIVGLVDVHAWSNGNLHRYGTQEKDKACYDSHNYGEGQVVLLLYNLVLSHDLSFFDLRLLSKCYQQKSQEN